MYIFLDESGDLGFDWQQTKPSCFFVITLLVCEHLQTKRNFSTAVKRTLRHINHANKKIGSLIKKSSTTLDISHEAS